MFPKNFEEKVGFDIIREQLRNYCTFSIGVENIDAMRFSSNRGQVVSRLRRAEEMRQLLADPLAEFPDEAYHDIREQLSRIKIEGMFLDGSELLLLRKTLAAADNLIRFFSKEDISQRFPLISSATSQIAPVAEFLRQIDDVIDRHGEVRDNASPLLADIRRQLMAAQGSVNKILNTILRQAQADGWVEKDVAPTMREGRLVIPVAPAYRRKIGGIVHDESASGKTVFIEPQQVVEANNRIRELESDEKREVQRILLALSDNLRPAIPDMELMQKFLGKIDAWRAKARLAIDIGAVMPHVKPYPLISWYAARHPLLLQSLRRQDKDIVPLDIRLDSENRILLISGPNAGGKSVCLKTVALVQYMMQMGLLVPLGPDSDMGLFTNMMIDIGDEQSIENDLSTYSSHLLAMKRFLRDADGRTLLLIDEFGSGTEPQIGGAIAQAALKRFNQSGAYGVITTHYNNLKHLAEDTPGIINGAMLYDRQQLQPLFQLEIGRPGNSFAVEIARKTGLPDDLIEDAIATVGTAYIDYEKHLQDIARDKRYWEQKRLRVHQREKDLEERISRYENELEGMKAKRRQAERDAKEQAAIILEQSHALIEKTIREIKEQKADKEATKTIRQQIAKQEKQLRKELEKNSEQQKEKQHSKAAEHGSRPNQEIAAGSYVTAQGQNVVGQVQSIRGGKAVVAFNGITMTLPVAQLICADKPAQKSASNPYSGITDELRQRKMHFREEADIRGMRGDDALQAVTYLVDDAIMVGATRLRILHGTGDGILRQLIRQYLDTVPEVKDYHDEAVQFGGAGITIVELDN